MKKEYCNFRRYKSKDDILIAKVGWTLHIESMESEKEKHIDLPSVGGAAVQTPGLSGHDGDVLTSSTCPPTLGAFAALQDLCSLTPQAQHLKAVLHGE